MKNLFKLFGTQSLRLCAIALAAIIGFSFAACSTGDDGTTNNNNNQQTQAPDITFTLSDGTAGDNKFEIIVSGAEWGDDLSVFFFTEYSPFIPSYLDRAYTLSADKKTLELAFYDWLNSSNAISEDTTTSVTFDDDADLKRATNGLLHHTSVNSTLKPEFYDMYNTQTYQGTVTLVGEGVSITIKDGVYKPE